MKKSVILAIALPLILNLSACGSASNSNSTSAPQVKSASVPLTLTLNENGQIPSLCSDYFQQGTVCTTDITITSTGKEPFDTNITVKAHDDQGRTYNSKNDVNETNYIADAARFPINPGEQVEWGLEFSVSKGTHLTSIDFFQDGEKIKTLAIDLQA